MRDGPRQVAPGRNGQRQACYVRRSGPRRLCVVPLRPCFSYIHNHDRLLTVPSRADTVEVVVASQPTA